MLMYDFIHNLKSESLKQTFFPSISMISFFCKAFFTD